MMRRWQQRIVLRQRRLNLSLDFYRMRAEKFEGFGACCSLNGTDHAPRALLLITFINRNDDSVRLRLCREHLNELVRVSGEVNDQVLEASG